MADTIRTIQELNSLLSDNEIGSISPQDLRDVLISMNVHTELGGGNLSGTIGTNWVKVPLNLAGVFERGFTADTVNNQISGTPVNMKVEIAVEAQIPTNIANGESVDIAVFQNGSQIGITRRTFDSKGHYSWVIGVQAAQNDVFDLRIRASAAGVNFTLTRALLRIKRIGIE